MTLPILFFLVIYLFSDGVIKQFPYTEQGVTLTFPTKALCDKALARVSKRAILEGLVPNRDFAMVCMDSLLGTSEWETQEFIHRYDGRA